MKVTSTTGEEARKGRNDAVHCTGIEKKGLSRSVREERQEYRRIWETDEDR
jgi:hypothetical protein